MADASGRKLAPGEKLDGLILHIGCIDVPYAFNAPIKAIKGFTRTKAMKARKPLSITTGEVAQILEDNYSLFSTFYSVYESRIAEQLEKSIGGALESLMMGQSVDPWGPATAYIEDKFKTAISSKEAENWGIKGTPTLAALKGVNHRLKHPFASRNPRRPSFQDTGLFRASLKSWID